MVRKTRQRPGPRPRTRRRRRQNTKKIHAATEAENAEVESHHYSSTMMFDGNTLVMKSQKDDEPVKEHIYTKKQLEREIPIGKELIDEYLDGKMPRGIQRPIPKEIEFRSVLPNPDDLGLLPPNASIMKKYKLNQQQKQTKRRRENQSQNIYNKQRENMRLMVQDSDDDDAALNADYAAGDTNRPHARNLFDLP